MPRRVRGNATGPGQGRFDCRLARCGIDFIKRDVPRQSLKIVNRKTRSFSANNPAVVDGEMEETDANSQTQTNPPPPAQGRSRFRIYRRPAESAEARSDRRIRKWAELWETIILTIATLATAWAGYEAGQWNNISASLNFQSTGLRVEAGQLAGKAQQLRAIDVGLFTNWVNAVGNGNTALAEFYQARFRDEFRPAFDAWIATRPLANPDAPDSPFDMEAYHVAAQDRADALIEDAGQLDQSSDLAGNISSNYTLSVLVLAGALLLAGLANRFQWAELRLVVVGAALLVLLLSVVNILRLPVA